MAGRSIQLLGVGSPLIDVLAHVSGEFLASLPGGRGGMEHVSFEEQDAVLAQCPGAEIVPGGSAANTVSLLSSLGMRCSLLGKLGNDAGGEFFRKSMQSCGCWTEELMTSSVLPTGRCISFITPDGERTMRSCPGASSSLTEQEVRSVNFSDCEMLYLEGFGLFDEVFDLIVGEGAASGCELALDLASFEVVKLFRERLLKLLAGPVDMVFANSAEASALFGESSPEKNLRRLAELCRIAVVKLGKEGALIASGGRICHVPASPVEHAVDTTGAGDMWAGGFLYGYFKKLSMEECGRMGALAAAAVITVTGARLPDKKLELLIKELKNGV